MTEEASKLELLKKQRAAFKGQLTYFKNQFSLASTLGSLESLLRRIQVVYDKYNAVQSKIEAIDVSTSDRESFEDDYGALESSIINKVYELKRVEDTSTTVAFHNSSIHEASTGNTVSTGIRLPELKIPSFSGAESEWLAFRDIFSDLIHSKNIEPTVKFIYLISHVRSGSAYSLIENLSVTAENYDVAWKTICDKYNNEFAIQRYHMQEIYEIKGPMENSSKALQSFIDKALKHYNALNSLKVKVCEWDLMFTHHLTHKLDNASRTAVIKNSNPTSILTFDDFINILRTRVRLLQALHYNPSHQPSRPLRDAKKILPKSSRSSSLMINSNYCVYCSESHSMSQCPSFNNKMLTPKMRFQFVRDNKLCVNCLIDRHPVRECMQAPCQICSLKHHTSLHFKNYQSNKSVRIPPVPNSTASKHEAASKSDILSAVDCNISGTSKSQSINNILESVSLNSSVPSPSREIILIGTALVNTSTSNGHQLICRALLDSGSHMNFITNDACNILKAIKYPTFKTIAGIGGKESSIKHKIYLTISSRVSDYSIELKFYVLPKITNHLPTVHLDFKFSSLPVEVKLADPCFNVPDRIDLLLGAEIYNQLFTGASIKLCKELPPFFATKLGYVVCGKAEGISGKHRQQPSHVALCSIQTLETQLRQFWELENISVKSSYSSEEMLCENHYCNNVKRLPDGRYSVALPVKPNIVNLESSHLSARRQFLSLEKRLRVNEELYQSYREFMSEYIALGHMVQVSNPMATQNYYMPHHYVLKNQSTTTKLRVVFNASSKTSSQLSLNDCLMVGPTIQQDLFSIVLRFRKHIYAFCGDIAKMYRQILVHDEQQNLQRIWWRNHSSEELQIFKLCTVTYGTASAPFLATRTLKQLSIDEHDQFPIAANVLASDFYVDDVLTGAATINEALALKSDLINLLLLGGFELRKFYSNDPLLSSEHQPQSPITLVLGLSWNTDIDHFEAQLDKLSIHTLCSKRNMLSEICQLFDPLGLCAPIIVTAKLFMQELWTLQTISWDDLIPDSIANKWIKFKTELSDLKKILVPRSILLPDVKRIELHGYGDASERAFGCVMYIRMTDNSDHHHVKLICAKSRVAPLKKQTIPRLELCAALLLAEMTNKLLNILDISFDAIYLWSDSEITLHWIKSVPHKYATFVANRVAKIQDYTSPNYWYYVNSRSNPADYVSRGLMPSDFLNATLWWNGPKYLLQSEEEWPKSTSQQLSLDQQDLDMRKPSMLVHSQTKPGTHDIFTRFQSLNTLLRVVAYIFRFYQNAANKSARKLCTSIHLRPIETSKTLHRLIKLIQQNEFEEDIKCLKTNHSIPHKSSLRLLSPFLDADGLLRVGGRLGNAPISYDRRHPLLLPGNHVLSKLIVRHEHIRLLHAGPQALLYNLRLLYWITGGRSLCRTVVNGCIRCFYARPHIRSQIMGDLPADRVTRSVRPFITVGIDFCGPFIVKQSVKSKINLKCYICLFICFTTKAVHLEIVMNLTTESFLACFRRFGARRGMCSKIYSDNATNFIGARSELADLKKLFLSQQFNDDIIRYCTSHNIEWHTIPPRSPHFGGLWESAIKSTKYHMKRVVGASLFTFEEFNTLISQIEACLNSRPLTAMSSDPSDLTVLSPGHFIVGSPLTALTEPSLLDLRTNRLSRFQLVQRNLQYFWKRWHVEYLTELQRRNKWQKGQEKYPIGALVLLHDDNLPPMKWSLGRIINTHPGKDGVIRVVTIKTAQSSLKRAVNRISVLPTDEES